MRIKVTSEDIENGKRGNCKFCPIALAVSRETGRESFVAHHYVLLGCEPEVRRDLPREASDFVYDFDNERPVEPFEFEMELK